MVAIQCNIYPEGGRDGKKGSKGDERKVRGAVVEIDRMEEQHNEMKQGKAEKRARSLILDDKGG